MEPERLILCYNPPGLRPCVKCINTVPQNQELLAFPKNRAGGLYIAGYLLLLAHTHNS